VLLDLDNAHCCVNHCEIRYCAWNGVLFDWRIEGRMTARIGLKNVLVRIKLLTPDSLVFIV
jgi:hypothetical protein